MTNEITAIISGIDSQTATDYHYRIFWEKIQSSDKNCIHKYWQHRNGLIRLDEDEANSLQMEAI